MTATARATGKRRLRRAAVFSVVAIVLVLAVLEIGYAFEFEYPFCLTLLLAEQTRTPNGSRVTDLIRVRSGNSNTLQHWHHCTYCDDIYPHAAHFAVQVTCSSERDFYLFDWDAIHRKLIPITVRTAKLLPELVPTGYVVKPLSFPQLNRDEPCVVAPPNQTAAGNAGTESRLASEHYLPGVPEPGRWATAILCDGGF